MEIQFTLILARSLNLSRALKDCLASAPMEQTVRKYPHRKSSTHIEQKRSVRYRGNFFGEIFGVGVFVYGTVTE